VQDISLVDSFMITFEDGDVHPVAKRAESHSSTDIAAMLFFVVVIGLVETPGPICCQGNTT